MEMTEEEKEALQEICEAGGQVATVAYDPETVEGDPEGDVIADGWVEFKREDSANLVEVVYTK